MGNDVLYSKEFVCPICGLKFSSMKVKMSKLKIERRASDLRVIFKDFNPVYYSVLVCPNCGYSATEKNMERVKPAQKKRLKDAMLTTWVKRNYGGERTFKEAFQTLMLGLATAQIADFKTYEKANLAMNIARFFEEEGNGNEAQRFLKTARDGFITCYMEGEGAIPDSVHEGELCYLIGELSRELGDKKTASTYMGMAMKDEFIRSDQGLLDLVRDQWQLVKEMAD